MIIASISISTLSACSGIGQQSLRSERNEYNDILKDTTTEQLLQNIVRAHDIETPSFFDVIELDQTKSVSGGLQASSANIGAPLRLYSLGTTATLTDSPILKYQPPSSQGYIAQVLNPIPLSSIANFYNSNANLTPLLVFSTNRLTPDFIDYDPAIDLIDFLDAFGAINFEAMAGDQLLLLRQSSGILTPKAAHMADPRDNSLDCFPSRESPNAVVADFWSKLSRVFGQPGAPEIKLHSPGAKTTGGKVLLTGGTVVLTRSALGSLRVAETHDVGFLNKEEAEQIIARNQKSRCFNHEFYYQDDKFSGRTIEQEWCERFRLASAGISEEVKAEERTLGHNRLLIIVQKTPDRPSDAYVSIRRGDLWYSISNDDKVSKMNFALLGNILIVQAQAPQQPPTATVIAAGAVP